MKQENSSGSVKSIKRSNLQGARRSPIQSRVDPGKRPPRRLRDAPRPRARRSSARLIVLIAVVLIIILVLLTTTFAKSTVSLTLRSAPIGSIDGVFDATREPTRSGDIAYSVKTFTFEAEEVLASASEEKQFSRARGTVTFYNTNPSGEPLSLINRSRLESPGGLIYRTVGKATIPGGKTEGDEFVPGLKELTIEADNEGATYNLENSGVRFSVPGLAKYKSFADSYAVSKTSVVGGFSGTRLVADSDEVEAARERLRREINTNLRADLSESIEGNTLVSSLVFDGGIFVNFETLPEEQIEESESVVIKERGVLRAVSFREADLANLLSKTADLPVDSIAPRRVDAKNLEISIEKDGDDFDITGATEFSFRLTGDANLYWDVDEVLFFSDISGKSKSEVRQIILEDYPQVESIGFVSVFPVWRVSIPKNRSKFTLVTKDSEVGDQ